MATRSSTTLLGAAVFVGALVGAALAVAAIGPSAPGTAPGPAASVGGDVTSLAQFGNETAFTQYVARGQTMAGSRLSFQGGRGAAGGNGGAARPDVTDGADVEPEAPRERQPARATQTPIATELAEDDESNGAPDRVGETNVQVEGLDEPDLVKTDGTHFYYSPEQRRPRPVGPRRDVPEPSPRQQETHVLDVREPASPEAVAGIDDAGRLLRTGDRLLVLGGDTLTAYDVSDPANPTEAWDRPLDDQIVTARERNGTVYLVTRSRVSPNTPCPIEPIGADAAVPCGDVYRPAAQVAVDATYTAFALDASDGDVRDSASFVGTSDQTAVYMSNQALYVTYTQESSRAELMATFLTEEFDRTPAHVERRIAELQSYDISDASLQREIGEAVRSWLQGLDAEERRPIRENLNDGFRTYLADRQRDLQRTGIVRVTVDGTDLAVAETGEVPGRPLNQFSLDEHEGTLRITTTVPGAGAAESENDLYVLDAGTLSEIGRETGMGESQEVFAVRYVGDTAYVVTFRRVDPFHVVDLSDPANPVERDELELPGFSSYLHPVSDTHVLGVGEEDGQVKTVLFDVSDPENPTIADDRIYQTRWSAVDDTHHAFTIDRRHGVFFLPASDAGYVVNYTGGELALEHVVETDRPALRARYVEDYLYVFAGHEVTVLDQTTWERETTLELAG